MHIEIQVALNFVISYLYNKLPRRRVNLFGEELEKALKIKFNGHWYPDKPVKGSAFRCLRVGGSPIDPVLEVAAQESGIDLEDIRENLPAELSVWIDPGEVSYRIGEKGAVKMLYVDDNSGGNINSISNNINNGSSSNSSNSDDNNLDKEVTRSFNPEAQCFKPIEAVSVSLGNLAVSPANSSSTTSPYDNSPSPSFKSTSPTNAFVPPKSILQPLTFTTATFAQTKFGSTKLKSNSKRPNRMSPTEFSNYIKQRAMQQQQQQPAANNSLFGGGGGQGHPSTGSPQPPQRPRSLSPCNPQDHQLLFMTSAASAQQHHQQQHHHHHHHLRSLFDTSYLGDIFSSNNGTGLQQQPQNKYSVSINPTTSSSSSATTSNGGGDNPAPFFSNAAAAAAAAMGINDNSKSLLDGINFNLNTMSPYPPNQHQHLLVAN